MYAHLYDYVAYVHIGREQVALFSEFYLGVPPASAAPAGGHVGAVDTASLRPASTSSTPAVAAAATLRDSVSRRVAHASAPRSAGGGRTSI